MVTIEFFSVDVSELGNEIVIFGKTREGKRIAVIDKRYKPYFYAIPESNAEELAKKISMIREGDYFVIDSLVKDKKFYDKPIKAIKVVVNKKSAIPVVKDIVKELGIKQRLLVDVPLLTLYLAEKGIKFFINTAASGELKQHAILGPTLEATDLQIQEESILPRILAFDIEVYAPAEAEFTTEPIVSIAFAGNDGTKKVITWKEFKKQDYVEIVKNEFELIKRFCEFIQQYDPDILVGYYSDVFDFPYLVERARNYGITLDIAFGSRISRKGAKLNGILHLDILQFIKNIMAGSLKLESYSLDYLARELIGEGKIELPDKISNLFDSKEGIATLVEYNLQDALLTLKIAEKIIPIILEISKIADMHPYEVCRATYGQIVENYLIKKALESNELIPRKPLAIEIAERQQHSYQGAFVMEPKPGFYKNLIIFDFRNLYPSIIVAKNISPATLNHEGKGHKIKIVVDEKEKEVFFDYKHESFIPKAIEELILRRIRIKELLKKEKNPILEARSYALKTIANAAYGYQGFFNARWYCLECAAAITAWARQYTKQVIKRFQDAGFEVIYSDTDSIAIELKNKTKEQALEFVDNINKELPSLMELEFENFYPAGIFVAKRLATSKGAKKKYALIDESGNLKISGFETVRRDWSKIARETQRKVLEIILKDQDPKKAFNCVKEIIKKLKLKEIPLEKLVIQTRLKMRLESYEQEAPHVAVARRMEKAGMPVARGMPVSYIVVEGKGKISQRCRIPEECSQQDYDAAYYIEHQVIPAVEKILEVFGFTKESLLAEKTKTLEEF